jgi:transposase, IS30 family
MLKEKKFNHIQPVERENISIFSTLKYSKRRMAKELGRSPSTITREFKRGTVFKGQYFAVTTQIEVDKKKIFSRRKRKTDNLEVQEYIIEKIKPSFLWSPEIISFKMKEELGISIGKDSIYKFVYENPELTQYLAKKHPGKKPHSKNKKTERTLIPNRIGIEKRPKEANKREEFGHFEADTIVSRESLAALLVLVDRMTRKVKIKKLVRKTAELTSSSIVFALQMYNIIQLMTITYDNGSEFCWHDKVNKALNMQSFFCNPYSSWEKGTVENINGLIRRFFPKRTDFDKITDEEIQQVEDWINNRPMKVLGYKSPNEKYAELQQNLSVAI